MSERGRVEKRVLDPRRVRRIGPGFSWIDRRFVRDGVIDGLERDEILLYLFLVCVADKDGLSFWSDARTASTLKVSTESLERGRRRLVALGLIAYERPLYQVLAIEDRAPRRRDDASGGGGGGAPRSMAEIFRAIAARREGGA